MTVSRLAERCDGQRWLSFAAVAGGANPPSAPDVRCRSVSPPPLPVYHGLEFIEFAASAAEAQRLGQHLQALGFSTRKPPLQTGDAVAQRRARIVINHQPHSWADHFINATGIALRDGAAGRAQRVACRPRPRWGMPPAGRRRAERNADPGDLRPDGSLIYLIDAGRLSTSAIFICVMA